MFSDLLYVLISAKSLSNLPKKSFRFDVGLVGKLDLIFSHVFAQILCRAISEVREVLQSLGDMQTWWF